MRCGSRYPVADPVKNTAAPPLKNGLDRWANVSRCSGAALSTNGSGRPSARKVAVKACSSRPATRVPLVTTTAGVLCAGSASTSARASASGAGARPKIQRAPSPLGSAMGRVNRTGRLTSAIALDRASSIVAGTPTTNASAPPASAARLSSTRSFASLPPTSVIRSLIRGVPRWASAHCCIALRCASPRGPRVPERSSSAVTAYVPGSRVGEGVGEAADGGGAAQAPARRTSVTRAARGTRLRAGPARDAFLRVHVLEEILGPWVRCGFGLVDRAFDLGGDLGPHGVELCLGYADRAEVQPSLVDRVLGLPLLEDVLRSVAGVVVVRAVRLVAVALRFDDARTVAATSPVGGVLGLRVHIEDVGPVRDQAGDPVACRAIGHVRHAHLLRRRRGDREEVVLDDEHDGQLVDAREVHRLVEVPGARRAVAAVREDDAVLLPDLDRERDAGGLWELRRDAHRAGDDVRLGRAELVHHLAPA